MELVRADLLELLKRVQPALADSRQSLLPVLSHLCFDGKYVTAYNNTVAMRVRCNLDFKGALPGSLLLSMLESAVVDNVVLTVVDEAIVTMKLGRATLKLSSLPETDFMFKRPTYASATKLVMDEKLTNAFRVAARSASVIVDDSSKSGITATFGSKFLTLYATNSRTLVRCKVPLRAPDLEGQSFIIPEQFYSLLLRTESKELLITEQGDLVGLGNGVELYGRVLQDAKPAPADYEAVFKASRLGDVPKADVPAMLIRSLEQARLVNRDLTTLSYSTGKLSLLSTGQGSELRGSAKIDLGEGSLSVITGAESLLRYLDLTKRIGLSTHSVVMEGDGFVVLVAVQQESDNAVAPAEVETETD